MPRQTSRKLEVFAIHAHFGDGADGEVNYQRLFQTIAAARRPQRVANIAGKSIALPEFRVDENLVLLTAYEGEEGNPLFFNFESATERIEQLARNEKLARKTHCVINITRREAAVEYNHRGAKASDVADALAIIGQRLMQWPELQVEFTPVIDQSFLQAINSFSRIRVATVKMIRPNQDWTDHANHLTALADESRGHFIEVTVNAHRERGLSERGGVIGFIRYMARELLPSLKDAKVIGTRQDEDAETTVSLQNHIAHQRVNVGMTDDGHVNDGEINEMLIGFLESRAERQRG
jgi:hypothetical protein